MALIDSDSYRVEAYFEETKIPHIKPGASAEIYLMDGSPALQGTVLGIARGITDQDNKDGPELLSSINPTFTWVRLAQRIPVTHPPDARTTRRVDQRRNDLHRRDEGRRGAPNRARHQEGYGSNFWSTFELARWQSFTSVDGSHR